ncbi:hypothetical protein NMY22_g17328 [Coprinellus aureogranulatus]|nr:hypothetical protein NMY22_g17328 [Coprinellus aureogranulatus]
MGKDSPPPNPRLPPSRASSPRSPCTPSDPNHVPDHPVSKEISGRDMVAYTRHRSTFEAPVAMNSRLRRPQPCVVLSHPHNPRDDGRSASEADPVRRYELPTRAVLEHPIFQRMCECSPSLLEASPRRYIAESGLSGRDVIAPYNHAFVFEPKCRTKSPLIDCTTLSILTGYWKWICCPAKWGSAASDNSKYSFYEGEHAKETDFELRHGVSPPFRGATTHDLRRRGLGAPKSRRWDQRTFDHNHDHDREHGHHHEREQPPGRTEAKGTSKARDGRPKDGQKDDVYSATTKTKEQLKRPKVAVRQDPVSHNPSPPSLQTFSPFEISSYSNCLSHEGIPTHLHDMWWSLVRYYNAYADRGLAPPPGVQNLITNPRSLLISETPSSSLPQNSAPFNSNSTTLSSHCIKTYDPFLCLAQTSRSDPFNPFYFVFRTLQHGHFPSFDHISLLEKREDWKRWDADVRDLLAAHCLTGFINHPDDPVDPRIPPGLHTIPQYANVDDTAADDHGHARFEKLWMDLNIVVCRILRGTLNSRITHQLRNSDVDRWNAYDLYAWISMHYGHIPRSHSSAVTPPGRPEQSVPPASTQPASASRHSSSPTDSDQYRVGKYSRRGDGVVSGAAWVDEEPNWDENASPMLRRSPTFTATSTILQRSVITTCIVLDPNASVTSALAYDLAPLVGAAAGPNDDIDNLGDVTFGCGTAVWDDEPASIEPPFRSVLDIESPSNAENQFADMKDCGTTTTSIAPSDAKNTLDTNLDFEAFPPAHPVFAHDIGTLSTVNVHPDEVRMHPIILVPVLHGEDMPDDNTADGVSTPPVPRSAMDDNLVVLSSPSSWPLQTKIEEISVHLHSTLVSPASAVNESNAATSTHPLRCDLLIAPNNTCILTHTTASTISSAMGSFEDDLISSSNDVRDPLLSNDRAQDVSKDDVTLLDGCSSPSGGAIDAGEVCYGGALSRVHLPLLLGVYLYQTPKAVTSIIALRTSSVMGVRAMVNLVCSKFILHTPRPLMQHYIRITRLDSPQHLLHMPGLAMLHDPCLHHANNLSRRYSTAPIDAMDAMDLFGASVPMLGSVWSAAASLRLHIASEVSVKVIPSVLAFGIGRHTGLPSASFRPSLLPILIPRFANKQATSSDDPNLVNSIHDCPCIVSEHIDNPPSSLALCVSSKQKTITNNPNLCITLPLASEQ